jgi:hypothetical protein
LDKGNEALSDSRELALKYAFWIVFQKYIDTINPSNLFLRIENAKPNQAPSRCIYQSRIGVGQYVVQPS